MRRNVKAQSTLEYVVVFAVIVVAVLALAYNLLRPAVNNVMTQSAGQITAKAGTFVIP